MSTGREPPDAFVGEGGPVRCSVAEAAGRLGISKRAVIRRIEKGTLPAERVGRGWVVMLPDTPRAGPIEPGQAQAASEDQSSERSAGPSAHALPPTPTEPGQGRPQDQIAQAIERLDARHMTRLRMLSQQIRQHANATESPPEGPPIRPGPWERELEMPASASSGAGAEEYQATEEDLATVFPQPAGPPPDPPAPAAEPAEDVSASQVDTSEQQWEALFTGANSMPATPTAAVTSPAGRPTSERKATTTPPTGNREWRERIDWWWQDLILRYAYRSRLIVTMLIIVVIMGVLLGAAVLLLLNSPAPGASTGAFLTATGPPAPAAATSAGLSQPAGALTPAAPTAASRAAASDAPTATQAAAQPTADAAAISSARATAPARAPTVPAGPSTLTLLSSTAVLLQRVAAAEAALHRGQIEATIDNADGTGAWARLRFDLGDATQPAAFHMTSTYTGTAGAQTIERITIGDQSWERQPNGGWSARPAQEGVMDQMQVFLPHADWIDNATLDNGDPNMLSWHDAARDTDVTLIVDPASGIPKELRRVTRAAGSVQIVNYRQWNTAVDILPPKEA